MANSFYNLTVNINQLERLILEHINSLLRKNNIYDLNANQALLLRNIGNDAKHVHDVNNSSYYLGTNISYSIGSLVKKGYIDRIKDNVDTRCAFLVLTQKGKKVLSLIDDDNMSQENVLKKIGIDAKNINEILVRLQKIF